MGVLIRFWGRFWDSSEARKETDMRKKGYKGRCEKRSLSKCIGICRTYNSIQTTFANMLQQQEDIKEFQCNVLLKGLSLGEYTSDFLCSRQDETLMVRECVFRKYLTKPLTVKLLDASREYWLRQGVTDWKVVVDAEK